jgi:acetoin utilization deacetylase AcuC-like enzyme
VPLACWSPARYVVALPDGHRFPIAKYALLRDAVLARGIATPATMHDPPALTEAELRLVHDARYVRAVLGGTLTDAEVRRLGFPWSPTLVERALRAAGGTLAAARHALACGVAMNLAGGTHHAFADRGEGFCVFNDVAVAIRTLRAERLVRRVVVLDLDVHQGNGTHAIFAGDADTTTLSLHGRRNYPFHKVPGTHDVELDDGCDDATYLALLTAILPRVLREARADLAFYLAGADPHERDRLGRTALTDDGLARRDWMVLAQCREIGLPVAIVTAGGYAEPIGHTVAVHVRTAEIAAAFG